MGSRADVIMAVTSMAAVGIVFGFLAGVVADTETIAAPIAAAAFLVTGGVFVVSRLASPAPILTRSVRS